MREGPRERKCVISDPTFEQFATFTTSDSTLVEVINKRPTVRKPLSTNTREH